MQIDLSSIPAGGDVLLILPPFAGIDRPSFGLHLLQALAKQDGFRVTVLYANIHLAHELGEELYNDICYSDCGLFTGERIFAEAAFGKGYRTARPPAGPATMSCIDTPQEPSDRDILVTSELVEKAECWVDALAGAIARLDYSVVGCNLMFEQTAATVALFRRLKALRPDLTLIAGGSLCEGQMAHGILSLSDAFDHVFSGESEETFVQFLKRRNSGKLDPRERIVEGKPCLDLNALPNVAYEDFFEQFAAVFPESKILNHGGVWLAYEGSRGCWWGQKHHCTFCGINGTGMTYREKTAERVYGDLAEFTRRYPTRKLMMLDNIMPHRYFNDLIPMLSSEKLELDIFYEQKANLTFKKMRALADAGINIIQPGIESLSDNMLHLMKKGVQARQNIAMLRFARTVEMAVNWNLLYGFPGDLEVDYRQMVDLIPLLAHLNPPSGLCHLSIDRFSPYHTDPERYGIRAMWPERSYFSVYPADSDLGSLAYHFEGDYDTAARRDPDLVDELNSAIEFWRAQWEDQDKVPPVLAVRALGDDAFLIVDTRDIRAKAFQFVDRVQAKAALIETRPGDSASRWAIDNQLAVRIADIVVPLAVTDRTLLAELLDERDEHRQGRLAA